MLAFDNYAFILLNDFLPIFKFILFNDYWLFPYIQISKRENKDKLMLKFLFYFPLLFTLVVGHFLTLGSTSLKYIYFNRYSVDKHTHQNYSRSEAVGSKGFEKVGLIVCKFKHDLLSSLVSFRYFDTPLS